MKSRLDLGFVAQPRNRPPTSSCCSCHHAARTQPRWPPGPSNEAYLSSPHLEASRATNFRACSSPAPTRVKPQPAPAILSQESVHTTLSITHYTRKRPSTGPQTTHGPQMGWYSTLSRSDYTTLLTQRGASGSRNCLMHSGGFAHNPPSQRGSHPIFWSKLQSFPTCRRHVGFTGSRAVRRRHL
jgi:hypothetical protein